MLYTRMAQLMLVIILLLGIMKISLGLIVATSENPKLAAARFLGSRTSGEMIDKGLLYIFIAITLGVLVEISINIKKNNDKNSKKEK